MSQETELKLSFPKEQLEQLLGLDFWGKYGESKSDCFHLGNTYFDTPDRALNKAQVALRIREKEGLYFQTLKTRGHSVNGLTRRGEWEWPITDPELDLSLLEDLARPELEAIDLNTLIPLFATDFQRVRWLLSWQNPVARVEAALDTGYVIAGDHKSAICELELELLEGSEQALMNIAERLSQYVMLSPSDQSKAERGFELLRVHYNKT